MAVEQKELAYKTVEREIRTRITSGRYVVGQQLPPERELERELGVSRLTIAKGLSNLASEGFISRAQGRGSFVCSRQPRGKLHERGMVKFISPAGVSDGHSVVSHGVLEGLHEVLSPGFSHVCVEFFSTVDQQLEILRSFDGSGNDGFVIWPALDERILPELRKMRNAGFPFVLIDAFFPEFSCDYIISDNCLGAELMIKHLTGLGHRRVAYFTAPPDRVSLSERLAGVISGLSRTGIALAAESINIIPCGDQVMSGFSSSQNLDYLRSRLRKLLDSPQAPSAIFASNDWIAMAIHHVLEEFGIRVPGDISLAGFDNIDTARYFKTPLTTMSQNFYAVGQLAAKVIMSRREDPGSNEMHFQNRVPPELIVRASTATPNQQP